VGTTVSAPGKVLVCGGHQIVEAEKRGVSLALTAKFHAVITAVDLGQTRGSTEALDEGKAMIRILSPQFRSEFLFECSWSKSSDRDAQSTGDGDHDRSTTIVVSLEQKSGPPSPFIRNSILYAIGAAISTSSCANDVFVPVKSATIELLADNDFYSQRHYMESRRRKVCAA